MIMITYFFKRLLSISSIWFSHVGPCSDDDTKVTSPKLPNECPYDLMLARVGSFLKSQREPEPHYNQKATVYLFFFYLDQMNQTTGVKATLDPQAAIMLYLDRHRHNTRENNEFGLYD